ncbi:nitrate ABC transporter substrate-binding protein [Moraxella caviae]|uniref:Bicarbonate transport ATP-binding protein CmpC n=1 Tax=Moraxella caviae TaxID=34060 RepID=A0A1T0A4Z3_9GAMM|nr:CmpA/NrtA family ABC transporter substrate-binding protein [Moraxella caviae]OOR90805.1 nitrate ABC transporter substrate-binding protein [Moraxella caviae]STZ10632.1 Bicarbonate transport ATP-binding protein CmpC [Moraxella caviae]
MPNIFRPFDTDSTLGCTCGNHKSQAECDSARHFALNQNTQESSQIEAASTDFIEAAAVKALFPHEPTRRAFLASVGKSTAMAAVASVLPLATLQEAAALDRLCPEKKNLTIGFIPIICSTPLIMADPLGYYAEQGLNASLVKRAGWALVRDQMMNRELDAAHFLAPMPLAISLGAGSAKQDMKVACIQNVNGQALVMALKHKDNRDPRNWKGMTFAIPFEHSMHNYLLRYFLAEYGLDPDRDVKLRLTTPPDMIANLKAGNIDGFFGPEPFNQRAVWDKAGYIHTLSRDIWNGHPCCSFGTSQSFISDNPQSFLAMYRAILKANVMANKPEMKRELSKILAPANYLNQPELVIRQSLTGRFADGVGKVQDVPDRTGFDAMPWHSLAVWMLTQMKRWGYIKGNVNYHTLAEQVFLLTDAKKQMAAMGYQFANEKSITVMGKRFDPAKPDAYLNSFKIKKS